MRLFALALAFTDRKGLVLLAGGLTVIVIVIILLRFR